MHKNDVRRPEVLILSLLESINNVMALFAGTFVTFRYIRWFFVFYCIYGAVLRGSFLLGY